MEKKNLMQQWLGENILKFWVDNMIDNEQGGFYGQMTGDNRIVKDADKGAVLNARILWAFSAAYRVLKNPTYLEVATRAKDYIIRHFVDAQYGGVYWSLDSKGTPKDTKKQTYAIGFVIYGMSEYARATGDEEALQLAISLYRDLEKHAFDAQNNGYVEALTRDWNPIADMRLSDKDENGAKTMNTHLHVIEPYTNLYRVWKDATLERQLRNLLEIFNRLLFNPVTKHLDLFFNDEWQGKRNVQSFGHDIEASWLLTETALVLGDENTLQQQLPIIADIARAADEGLLDDGSMISELWTDSGHCDAERYWWVQCENVIGHVNLYQYLHDKNAFAIAQKAIDFIGKNLIDQKNGEWYWGVYADGTIDHENDKAGFWKCPYHNTRMCLEMIERGYTSW